MANKKELEEKRLEDYHILTKDEEKKGDYRLQRLFISVLGLFFFIGSLILIHSMLTEGLEDGSCSGWQEIALFIFISAFMLFGLILIIASFLKTIIPKREYEKTKNKEAGGGGYFIDGVPACDDDFRDAIMEIYEEPEVITFGRAPSFRVI